MLLPPGVPGVLDGLIVDVPVTREELPGRVLVRCAKTCEVKVRKKTTLTRSMRNERRDGMIAISCSDKESECHEGKRKRSALTDHGSRQLLRNR